MNFILPVSIIGISASILLGVLFILKGKEKKNLISNFFLGLFFFLLSIRLGKLFVQEFASSAILSVYFNLMQAVFVAIGPVIWLYIRTYLSPKTFKKQNELIHFIPTLILMIGAFYLRQIGGEFIWKFFYWGIQIHPLLYVFFSGKFLIQNSEAKNLTANQNIWLYSLLVSVIFIVVMNILYFIMNFPFYLVTALLLIITVYLICFLAFNNKLNVLIGISDLKYQNLNLDSKKVSQLHKEIKKVLMEEDLFLDEQLRISDISGKLNTPSHIISSVINDSIGKTFPQYVNDLRIEKAKEILIEDEDKKIIAVAFESGFRSLSAFNRVFKKHSNLSPTQFRKKYSVKNNS